LGIEFPGGPQIEILAEKGDPNKYDLPKPIFNKGGCNLSFAGLKTAILRITKNIKTDQEKFDLAASFQKTVEQILYKKTKIAFSEFEKQNDLKEKIFVVAGGVAANKRIRSMLIIYVMKKIIKAYFHRLNFVGIMLL
jgi:N6-L-threonylcarbamoyladenine synthase